MKKMQKRSQLQPSVDPNLNNISSTPSFAKTSIDLKIDPPDLILSFYPLLKSLFMKIMPSDLPPLVLLFLLPRRLLPAGNSHLAHGFSFIYLEVFIALN